MADTKLQQSHKWAPKTDLFFCCICYWVAFLSWWLNKLICIWVMVSQFLWNLYKIAKKVMKASCFWFEGLFELWHLDASVKLLSGQLGKVAHLLGSLTCSCHALLKKKTRLQTLYYMYFIFRYFTFGRGQTQADYELVWEGPVNTWFQALTWRGIVG